MFSVLSSLNVCVWVSWQKPFLVMGSPHVLPPCIPSLLITAAVWLIFRLKPPSTTSLPHQSIHHAESLEPPFTPPVLLCCCHCPPSLLETAPSGQNLHSFTINLGSAAAVKSFHSIHNFNPPSVCPPPASLPLLPSPSKSQPTTAVKHLEFPPSFNWLRPEGRAAEDQELWFVCVC